MGKITKICGLPMYKTKAQNSGCLPHPGSASALILASKTELLQSVVRRVTSDHLSGGGFKQNATCSCGRTNLHVYSEGLCRPMGKITKIRGSSMYQRKTQNSGCLPHPGSASASTLATNEKVVKPTFAKFDDGRRVEISIRGEKNLKSVELMSNDLNHNHYFLYPNGRVIAYARDKWVQMSGRVLEGKKAVIKSCFFNKVVMKRVINAIEVQDSVSVDPKYDRSKRVPKFGWEAQGVYGEVTNAIQGFKDVLKLLADFHSKPELMNAVLYTMDKANETAIAARKLQSFVSKVISKLFSVISIVVDVASCALYGFNILSVAKACINIYVFVKDSLSSLCAGGEEKDEEEVFEDASSEWSAQGMEAFLLSLATMILPPKLYEVIKRMSTFTSAKLLDDFTCVHEFVSHIVSFFEYIVDMLPLSESFKLSLKGVMDMIPFGNDHLLLDRIQKVYAEWKRDKTVLMSATFVEKTKKLQEQLSVSGRLKEWSRRSAQVAGVIGDFSTVYRALLAYEDAGRVEPSCFIFEGRAGVMKSYFVTMLLSALDEPRYIHSIKPSNEGKDFWDMYNNENIVVMDDVGQQDVSQWRMLINLVSPLKFPLDCARAELKDTKFFSSSKLMLTTNRFTKIQGLTKQDGIGEIEALWRRGYVFDFDVVRVDGVDEFGKQRAHLNGEIKFMYYDLNSRRFVQSFPPCFRSVDPNLQSSFMMRDHGDMINCVEWMAKIVKIFDYIKVIQKQSVQLSSESLDRIRSGVKSYFDDLMNRGHNGSGQSNLEAQNNTNVWTEIMATRYPDDEATWENQPEVPLEIEEDLYLSSLFGVADDEDLSRRERFYRGLKNMLPSMRAWMSVIRSYVKEYVQKAIDGIVGILRVLAGPDKNKSPDLYELYWMFVINIIHVVILYLTYKVTCWYAQGGASSAEGQSYKDKVGEVKSTIVQAVSRQTFELKIRSGGKDIKCHGLLSGHYVVTTAHCCPDEEGYVTVYKNRAEDHRLLDQHKFKRVYVSLVDDVSVLELDVYSMTPFKNLSSLFLNNEPNGELWLTNAYGSVAVQNIINKNKDIPVVYSVPLKDAKTLKFSHDPSKVVTYSLEESGMCGTVLCNTNSGVVGMHVAGSSKLYGASVVWSLETRRAIGHTLKGDKFILEKEVSKRVIPNFSGVKLDESYFVNVPSKSKIVPSQLYGSIPNDKEPADLSIYGYHTVKDVAKKSFTRVSDADEDELKFAESAMKVLIPVFSDISDQEVIKGSEELAGINKKSSNGFGCAQGKESYIDFEKGEVTTLFRGELNDFVAAVTSGEVPFEKSLSSECLKDEIRDFRKNKVPRSFRVSTIHTQFLTKKLTGDMVKKIIRHRDFNQIMVGVNPYKEWDQIYRTLSKCEGVWAADIGRWDGSMLPQAQRAINEIILSKYRGEQKELLGYLLGLIPTCPVVVQDDLYLTTHSMPSGNFLTAIYNSLVNRFYTAMWYKRVMGAKATVNGFLRDVVDFVYGDDKLNGVRDKSCGLNALSMRDFYNSIGMELTTASKDQIHQEFESLTELSFLKRHFLFHPEIGRVMCPLDIKTIFSTLNWVDRSKDEGEVMAGKISSFQRELFLHSHLFEDGVALLRSECLKNSVPFVELTREYLLFLFTEGVDELKNVYGVHDFNF